MSKLSECFFAKLRGSREVPHVQTDAFGMAKFKVSNDETRMGFRLTVNDLCNFTQAHIHLGRKGENGPVVAFLFGPVDRDISVKVAEVDGVITKEDLVGPLAGKPLSKLLHCMRVGEAYVNCHTVQYPDGEIRGQIQKLRD